MSDLQDVINLRRTLHRYPELSNLEFETSKRISAFINALNPDEEISISKTGKAFVFEGEEPGETLIFRCELDALPIQEKSNLAYRSSIPGVAHLCGHDGHMAIIARLGQLISQNRPKKGKAVLLFQPAEENYLGAKDVVESKEFHALSPDYIFALHNIPGVKKDTVLLKTGSFTAASCGFTVKLDGRTSHAAEPQNGLNPYYTATDIIDQILELANDNRSAFSDHTIATLIYIRLGEVAFGVSPGSLEMGITLRAYQNEDLDLLCNKSEAIVADLAEENGLDFEWSYSEIYPATLNDADCVGMISDSAKANELTLQQMDHPNNWSEDFAYFTATNKGAQFGFGAGESLPPLHNPGYDFPDDIIEPAALTFFSIYKEKLL
ncbi:MAG: amidohydrolase [Gracilimonas sp.]|uniref:amidohydrolase n=1 Tax=Gracilimonas TaxID=649462 RepID=UPI001B155992|nr:amidohydrolase [Gracilimonas sp.]MBO6585285.1 amidohydrolase [Gracilimonas sp.]MBO6616281.1 amidohydrolase [Gracilimonas sp.]